jgi:hypothetical protein
MTETARSDVSALRWYDFMQGPGRFRGIGAAAFGDMVESES